MSSSHVQSKQGGIGNPFPRKTDVLPYAVEHFIGNNRSICCILSFVRFARPQFLFARPLQHHHFSRLVWLVFDPGRKALITEIDEFIRHGRRAIKSRWPGRHIPLPCSASGVDHLQTTAYHKHICPGHTHLAHETSLAFILPEGFSSASLLWPGPMCL